MLNFKKTAFLMFATSPPRVNQAERALIRLAVHSSEPERAVKEGVWEGKGAGLTGGGDECLRNIKTPFDFFFQHVLNQNV